ncbi:MAG: hypothetical protein AABX27_03360 [Nanoarchaeota archaeon]
MRKAVLLLLVLALFAMQVIAEEPVEEQPLQASAPETVENRMSIEFHSVSGEDKVVLNLPEYFGGKANFVASKTEHVNVEIDSNGMATLSPKDPTWRGIEEVVFAISLEYLTETEKPKTYVPRVRELSEITSKDKIALISDAFTQEQYETVVGSLSKEPVVISSQLYEDALSIDLNKEVTINFSSDKNSIIPKISFDFHAKEGNITLAKYEQPSDTLFLSLLILGVGTILVLVFYLHYAITGPLKSAMFAPKKAPAPASRASQFKGEAASKIKNIKRRIGKESNSKLYKEALLVMNSFITKSFRVSGANIEAAETKLDTYGVSGSLKSDILSYLTEYREAAYRASEIKEENVETLISLAESIINRL